MSEWSSFAKIDWKWVSSSYEFDENSKIDRVWVRVWVPNSSELELRTYSRDSRFQTLPMIRITWIFVFVHKSSGIFDFWKKYLDSMSDWRIMTIRYLKTSKKSTFLKFKILAPFEAQTWAVDLWWISVQLVKHDSFNFDFTKSSSAELRISSVWWVIDIRKFWKLA